MNLLINLLYMKKLDLKEINNIISTLKETLINLNKIPWKKYFDYKIKGLEVKVEILENSYYILKIKTKYNKTSRFIKFSEEQFPFIWLNIISLYYFLEQKEI